MISQRAANVLNIPNLLLDSWLRYHSNPYSKDNPNGIINLGTAENKLVEELISSKLSDINMSDIDPQTTHYCTLHGLQIFRENLAKFFTHYMYPVDVEITSDNIFVVNGGGTAVEMLGFALCDVNEGIMIPTPFYSAFETDFNTRFHTNTFPVDILNIYEDGFDVNIEKLQNSYNQLLNEGQKVRGILISNPVNPLGVCFSSKQLEGLLEFCLTNNIHFICDEVYFLSVYDKKYKHKNILSLPNISKYLDIVHIVWSFSKTSGYRVIGVEPF